MICAKSRNSAIRHCGREENLQCLFLFPIMISELGHHLLDHLQRSFYTHLPKITPLIMKS